MGDIKNGFQIVGGRFETGAVEEEIPTVSCFREISEQRRSEFLNKGYNKKRPFFPHRIYYMPRAGSDEFKLAQRMCGESDPNKLWEIVLYATSPAIDEFPEELFFDDDLIWHQQQFGKTGHIAFAYLVTKGDSLYGLNYVSDLVQRQSRRRDYKTRIEKKFRGWHYLLLNSILNFAVENNIKKIYSPTSDLAMEHTDPKRTVQRELFERVYDRAVCKLFRAIREGKWWVIDVAKNKDAIITPEEKQEIIKNGRTICLCHDIERGLGHIETDPNFAELANNTAPTSLEEMLIIEKELNVKATYNVTGCLFSEVRERIEKDGHCIAFHSYDHNIFMDQLSKCRRIDYRVKGYRPPQSKITPELNDKNLCYRNFEWLASSARSLGIKFPKMENRIVKLPILFDDFDLYKSRMKYQEWEQKAIESIQQNNFAAFCLHDCYAPYWLPHYREFLKQIRGLGKLKTLNEVVNEVILGSCR